LFRPVGACSGSTFHPRLAPWAAFLRRFAALLSIAGPLFGCAWFHRTVRKLVLTHCGPVRFDLEYFVFSGYESAAADRGVRSTQTTPAPAVCSSRLPVTGITC